MLLANSSDCPPVEPATPPQDDAADVHGHYGGDDRLPTTATAAAASRGGISDALEPLRTAISAALATS